MPIYEYACSCGKRFEVVILRPSDEDEVRCPACESKQVERAISQPAPSRPATSLKGERKFKKVR